MSDPFRHSDKSGTTGPAGGPPADHSDRPFGRNIYFQATDFTCGPACLMMALAALDDEYQPSHLEELVIWREANLVLQGDPPAGCGPYGLARAALRRGYTVDIYEHQAENIMLTLCRVPEQQKILETITKHDRERAVEQGCRIHKEPLSSTLIADLIAQDKQIIALTFGHEDGHWVIVHDLVGKNIFIIDPYKADEKDMAESQYYTDTGRHFIHYTDAAAWMRYGPEQRSVLLAIGKKGSAA